MNIALLLQMAADAMADRVAIGPADGGLDFAALGARATAAAGWIANTGEAANVAYLGLNSPAFPIALFAAGMAGRPFVPLNYRLPDAELARLVERTAPCILIADAEFLARVPALPDVTVLSRDAFLTLAAAEPPVHEAAETENDIALLLFTSGTTGEPKAAILRHRNLAAYVIQTVEFAGAGEEEALLVSVPPYHIAGVSAVLTSVYGGRRIVQLPAFSPEDWVGLARQERVTHAMVVPTMLGRILDLLESTGERLPALRHLSYGGGRMPVSVIERALALLPHVDFVNAYGLTETSSTIAILGPDDHRLAFSGGAAERQRLGSVGKPLPSVEIEIRDAEGVALPPGMPGEIFVRGEQVSGEYIGRKAIGDDGWLKTNDCGWLDEAGYLYIDGRLDDVIVRGGENISPGEIEDVLRTHPMVQDVAVFGLPSDEWGEAVAAAVVPADTVDPGVLKDWVRQRLRSTRVPEQIQFRTALPYNETGKLLRRVLKAELSG